MRFDRPTSNSPTVTPAPGAGPSSSHKDGKDSGAPTADTLAGLRAELVVLRDKVRDVMEQVLNMQAMLGK